DQGIDISELLGFIRESSAMSESLVDYGEQKPCAVTRTTAKTLAEFLGVSMVKDKGMHCQYIVARESQAPLVSECAVPVAVFETDAEIAKFIYENGAKSPRKQTSDLLLIGLTTSST
uniref:DNA polymerase epsilon catalytic subunit n=2 Tax=Aegilops tauschii subsp. strangulata TaxID=200361 RepID=A0A452ZVC5_AEGTS